MNSSLRQVWRRWNADILVALAGVNLLAIFIYLGNWKNLLHPIANYLALYAVAFGFYIYAGRIIQSRAAQHSRSLAWIIVVMAIAFRLAVVHGPASLSTDIYRYVWDGRLTCHWINPYRWTPLDSRLAQYRDLTIWLPMEYKAYQTVYMPISQLFFAIGYAIFRNNLIGYKFIFTLCDIGIVLLVMAILKRMGKDPARAIWYAWCPLPVIEVSLAGHQDVTGILMLMLAIYLLTLGRQRAAAVALAAAGLTKGFALLLLPLVTRKCGLRLILATALSLLYLGLPLWVYLPKFLHGMQQYLDYVHVNSGLFGMIDFGLCFITPSHFKITSILSDGAILTALAWSVWTKTLSYEEMMRRAIVVIAVCLLVVPSLFPWYVLWLLPLVTIYGDRPSAAFLCLAGTVDLVYIYYFDSAVHWWVPSIEYLPVYALLILEVRKGYWRPAILGDAGGSPGPASDIDSDGVEPSSDVFERPGGADATW
jgi:alpha-1,6-mannosyltransferase